MLTGQKSLYELFAHYDEERLLRILTVERAMYRPEALTAAENILTERGVELPLIPFGMPEPPAAQATAPARPTRPYQLIDAVFDILLVCLVCWAAVKLWTWTMVSPEWGGWSQFAFWLLAPQLLGSAVALRQQWRTKKWWD
ncbi:MAG TPA: hypothetical protein VF297_16835 [Pyrinomonadaceae bacterium]